MHDFFYLRFWDSLKFQKVLNQFVSQAVEQSFFPFLINGINFSCQKSVGIAVFKKVCLYYCNTFFLG